MINSGMLNLLIHRTERDPSIWQKGVTAISCLSTEKTNSLSV